MTLFPFGDDWSYRHPTGPFAGAFGGGTEATTVRLPHDALRDEERRPEASSGGASAYFPSASYTYQKDFDVPSDWAEQTVHLEIEGAFRRAQVFLNDEFVGNRADGYARFFVDLTPYLSYGATNRLRIEVRAGDDSRWYSGAGLHRPVRLHVAPAVHISPDGVHVSTLRIEPDQAVVVATVDVRNRGTATHTSRVSIEVRDAAGKVVGHVTAPHTLAPGEQAQSRQILYLTNPQLWSPDSPHLYDVSVSIGGDCVRVPFGIRTVTVDPRKGLRLNGAPILLRGACVHHDNGPLGAAAIGRAEERRVELLKAAGFNAIRAAHNPLSVAMLNACDRLGMLVIDEAFDMWTRFKTPLDYAADFAQWWGADLDAMVLKDRNHPSVIMYSIGNEIAEVGTRHGARWTRRLAERVRTLDGNRPITVAVNAMLSVIDEVSELIEELGGLNAAMSDLEKFAAVDVSENVTRRIEEAAAAVDVFGLNYAETRYPLDAELSPDRVLLGSETYPPEIGRLWPIVKESPNVIGDFTWTGWDYLGEVGIGSTAYAGDNEAPTFEREYPFLTAWTGDIDITGHRRPVSFYREIVFGLRTEPYVAVRRPAHFAREVTKSTRWAWSDSIASWTWPGFEGKPITVEVYGDADEVVLFVNDTEIGRGRTGTERPMLTIIESRYLPGTLVAVAIRDGVEISRTTLRTAGPSRLTVRADRPHILANDDDLAFITVSWEDEMGTLDSSSDTEVTVLVKGAGTLVGMASANPSTTERFDSPTWRTFDGRAIAVVRPTASGRIDVSVSSGEDTVETSLRAL